MITVTNEMTCGRLDYTSGEYHVSGDFKVLPTGKMNSINVSILKGSNDAGNVSAFSENGSLKYSYNRISKEDSEAIPALINAIVSELETKYKPVTE